VRTALLGQWGGSAPQKKALVPLPSPTDARPRNEAADWETQSNASTPGNLAICRCSSTCRPAATCHRLGALAPEPSQQDIERLGPMRQTRMHDCPSRLATLKGAHCGMPGAYSQDCPWRRCAALCKERGIETSFSTHSGGCQGGSAAEWGSVGSEPGERKGPLDRSVVVGIERPTKGTLSRTQSARGSHDSSKSCERSW